MRLYPDIGNTNTSQIWGLADTENRGFLQQEDFAKALRLIGIYQAQPGRPLDPELAMSRMSTKQ